VKIERNFAGCSLSWNLLLEQINVAFPDILFLPYVCQTGVTEVRFCYIAIHGYNILKSAVCILHSWFLGIISRAVFWVLCVCVCVYVYVQVLPRRH